MGCVSVHRFYAKRKETGFLLWTTTNITQIEFKYSNAIYNASCILENYVYIYIH